MDPSRILKVLRTSVNRNKDYYLDFHDMLYSKEVSQIKNIAQIIEVRRWD